MFKGDSMYSILPIDATYFFNITKNKYIIPKVIIIFQITSGDKKTEKSPHTLTASLSRLRQREDELQPSGDA